MDPVINIPSNGEQQSGGLVMQDGIEILLGDNAAIVLNELSNNTDTVSGWRCKSASDVDFRCSANWASNQNRVDTKGGIPCEEDTVWFTDSFNVDNSGVPIVNAVVVMKEGRENEYESAREIGAVNEEFKGFAQPFVATSSFSTDAVTMAAAKLECFDSCPDLDTLSTADEKYNAAHEHLVKRQEFITEARAAIGEKWSANEPQMLMESEQVAIFGRANVYVFAGAAGKTDPAIRITEAPTDAAAFVLAVETAAAAKFAAQDMQCMQTDGQIFAFTPKNCAPLVGFGSDSICVNGVADAQLNLFDDACPTATNSLICASNTLINVQTRLALEDAPFATTTCGEFDQDVSLWTRLSKEQQAAASEVCCELKENVQVLGCGFTSGAMHTAIAVDLFADGAIEVTQGLFHGADQGKGLVTDTKCDLAYVARDIDSKIFPVNIFAADGEFLQTGENADLEPAIAVAALTNAEFATSLTEWEVSDKKDDFDEKFHVKKFRGEEPEGDRKRRGFAKVKRAVESMMENDLPFVGAMPVSFDDIQDGEEYPGLDAQVVITDLKITWLQRNSLALVDHSKIERYIANILVGYGMEAAEYALKVQEFEFLTTSTTTSITVTKTTTSVTETLPAEASGTPIYLTVEKTGAFVCIGAEAKDGNPSCPEEDRKISITTKLADLKEVFGIEVAAAKKARTDASNTIADLEEDLTTKRALYTATKRALDDCDKAGLDKVQSIAYPDTCASEKKEYDTAAADFVSFINDGAGYLNAVQRVEQARMEAEALVLDLQVSYQEDLAELVEFNDAIHSTDSGS